VAEFSPMLNQTSAIPTELINVRGIVLHTFINTVDLSARHYLTNVYQPSWYTCQTLVYKPLSIKLIEMQGEGPARGRDGAGAQVKTGPTPEEEEGNKEHCSRQQWRTGRLIGSIAAERSLYCIRF
jgi:hypothetical protein